MPQINLLGQDSQRYSAPWTKGPLYTVRLFAFLFVAMLAYWGYLFVRTRITTKEVADIQAQIIKTQKEILSSEKRRELLVRQGQLDATGRLLQEHKYWSRLLPELARVTLKTASYISFSADSVGTAHMVVTVPSYKDFDKFLQVFDLAQFNDHYFQVTVSSVGKFQQGDTQSVRFDVTLHYDQEFLRAAEPVSQTSPAQ
jgi:cell division protein FtsB